MISVYPVIQLWAEPCLNQNKECIDQPCQDQRIQDETMIFRRSKETICQKERYDQDNILDDAAYNIPHTEPCDHERPDNQGRAIIKHSHDLAEE
ncbi:hypothetical protein ROBYS_43290 [Roseobacter sp. OBYS 0001]|nr:hypothetical protein ROBYS_43290 [Roseobacter sp. OBYS 0001]